MIRTARWDGLFALLIGLAAFLLYSGGGAILDPTNTDWLMSGDPATGWLGWQFFRDTPLLQWPLGANPGYGMALGSSIVFSDSVPLLALLLRPFDDWLPPAFQYFGFWLAACCALQSFFGWKLLRLSTHDRLLALLGGALFAIAPVMLHRLMGHYALTGHWLLLAGLTLYLHPDARPRRWLVLLAIAVLVHAYLLLMLLGLFAADLVQRAWRGQRRVSHSVLVLALAGALVAVMMWALGYFMLGGVEGVGVGNGPYGHYHMNLHALIDPDQPWSLVVADRAGGPGDYEGFAYLGSGVLLLALVALGLLLTDRRRLHLQPARVWPLLVLAAGLVGVALSNRIALGPAELLAYPLPDLVSPFTSAFRVSGRFAWIPYYLLTLAVLWVLATRLSTGSARALMLLALLVQLVDGRDAARHFGLMFAEAPEWTSPMRSPRWDALARRHDKLLVAPPRNNTEHWLALAEFGSRHGLSTQAGAFARVEASREAAARERLARQLVEGPVDPRALYVIQDPELWRFVSSAPPPGAYVGVLDGFQVLAPAGCEACPSGAPKIGGDAQGTGEPIAMDLLTGWSGREDWGTWSDGHFAFAAAPLPAGPPTAMEIEIEGWGFLSLDHRRQRVRIQANGVDAATISYAWGRDQRRVRFLVPRDLVARGRGRLLLRFDFPDATSPAALGQSVDGRQLALGVVALRMRPVPDA